MKPDHILTIKIRFCLLIGLMSTTLVFSQTKEESLFISENTLIVGLENVHISGEPTEDKNDITSNNTATIFVSDDTKFVFEDVKTNAKVVYLKNTPEPKPELKKRTDLAVKKKNAATSKKTVEKTDEDERKKTNYTSLPLSDKSPLYIHSKFSGATAVSGGSSYAKWFLANLKSNHHKIDVVPYKKNKTAPYYVAVKSYLLKSKHLSRPPPFQLTV